MLSQLFTPTAQSRDPREVARGFWEDWVVIGAATSLASGGVGTAKPDEKGDGGYKIRIVCAASQKTATLRFLFTVSLMALTRPG